MLKYLKKLKNVDLQISLDDFGTGYSSMLYLQELPVDKIKIDKSFINDLYVNIKSQEIVKVIILMTKTLNLFSCAEGVESNEQLEILSKLGCDQIQGFIQDKSLPLETLLTELYKKVD